MYTTCTTHDHDHKMCSRPAPPTHLKFCPKPRAVCSFWANISYFLISLSVTERLANFMASSKWILVISGVDSSSSIIPVDNTNIDIIKRIVSKIGKFMMLGVRCSPRQCPRTVLNLAYHFRISPVFSLTPNFSLNGLTDGSLTRLWEITRIARCVEVHLCIFVVLPSGRFQ